MDRRRVMLAAGKRPRLPREYQEVECLTALNGEYFSIPVSANGFEVKYKITSRLNANAPFVVSTNPRNITMFVPRVSSGVYCQAGGGPYKTLTKYDSFTLLNTEYTVSINKDSNEIISNGNTIDTISVGSSISNTIYLLKGDASNVIFYGQIYFAKLYFNHGLMCDLVPCYRKSDSKPGMYDTVTKTFYTNAGTGEFIAPA